MELPEIPLSDEGDSFQMVIAILIALVTLVGAVIAWRASVASVQAGDADFAGLIAVLNAEQTLALNNTTLQRHYRAYTEYAMYNGLRETLANGAGDEAGRWRIERAQAANLAVTNELFFPIRYLQRDGSYDVDRELGEAWAQAGQAQALDPAPAFVEADAARRKSSSLVAIFILLTLSLLFYTFAESLHPARRGLRLIMAAAGTFFLLSTIAAGLMIEFTL